MKKRLLLTAMIYFSLTFRCFGGDSLSLVDDVVTWGAGISGATSMYLCSNFDGSSPNPVSFYTFNGAMITYWAMDLLISDEDKDASEEIASMEYNGVKDEQMNSYLRARDLAKANKEAAEKKGLYKQAAAVVMLASAALALSEESRYETSKEVNMKKVETACASVTPQTTGTPAAKALIDGRCQNIGGAKVGCSDAEKKVVDEQKNYCTTRVSLALAKSTDPASCQQVLKGETMKSLEKSENSVRIEDLKLTDLAATSSDSEEEAMDFKNNPITKVLTLGGLQFGPGTRALTYGALSLIVGINAYANNSAAKEYEKEEEDYQKLIDQMEDCGDDCHVSDDDSNGDSCGDETIDQDTGLACSEGYLNCDCLNGCSFLGSSCEDYSGDGDNNSDDGDSGDNEPSSNFHHTTTGSSDGGKSLVLCPGDNSRFDNCSSNGVDIPFHGYDTGRIIYWNMHSVPTGDIVCTKDGESYTYRADATIVHGSCN